MGRKKIVEDAELTKLTNAYIAEICKCNPRYFKYVRLADYICTHGHPGVTARLLQRNPNVRGCIEEWKTNMEATDKRIVIAYKTLDVDDFVSRNNSLKALKKSLSELDNYYKSVCDAAMKIIAENQKLQRKVSDLSKKSIQQRETTKEINAENTEMTKEIDKLKKENKSLREVVNNYVYPEIANEILKKKGLLRNTPQIVSAEAIEYAMITSDTDLSVPLKAKHVEPKAEIKSGSAIITGMFNKFNGE